jgi:indoleamine 2,3-dioxygenase
MPILPTASLRLDARQLLRARHVLIFLLHFYVHSLSGTNGTTIPASVSVPLLIISHVLDLPPVVTYADTEFYNFTLAPGSLMQDNQRGYPDVSMNILTTFSGTRDEAHFYITGLRIEVEGIRALQIMRDTLAALQKQNVARSTIVASLRELATRIRHMAATLDAVREQCNPITYYDDVRLWFNGSPCPPNHAWVFVVDTEGGIDEDADLKRVLKETKWVRVVRDGKAEMREMAGASAAQSSTIQALDAFLGIDLQTHEIKKEAAEKSKGNFLERMREYMPREHRDFVVRLGAEGMVLREWVAGESAGKAVQEAYNDAIDAMRQFRSVHIRIATLYIVNPRRRSGSPALASNPKSERGAMEGPSLGTGGTMAIHFLKSVRDRTVASAIL